MKSAIVAILLLLFCFSTFAADRNKVGKIKDLDRQIANIITGENAVSIQHEELKKINRELNDLIVNETDPEIISLYHEVKTRLKDLYPGIE